MLFTECGKILGFLPCAERTSCIRIYHPRKHIALIKAGAATRNVLYSFGDKKRNIRICRPLTGTVKRRRSHYGTLRRQRC